MIINIDEMSCICGYFTGATDANNGYGCNHPEQEDFEILYKDEEGYTHRSFDDYVDGENMTKQGKCYAFSCPMASKCNLEDVKDYEPDTYKMLLEKYNGNIDKMEAEVDSFDNLLISEELYNELKGASK